MRETCLFNLDDGLQMQFINLDDLEHQHMNKDQNKMSGYIDAMYQLPLSFLNDLCADSE